MSGTAVPRGYEVQYHCKEEGCKFYTTELRLIEDHTSTHSPAPRVTPHKARPDMCGRKRVSARLAGKTRGRRKVAGAKISVTAENAADVDEDVVMRNDVDEGMKVDVNDVMADNDVKTDVNDVKATFDSGEMKCDIAGEKTDAGDIKVEQDHGCMGGESKAAVKAKAKEKVNAKVKGKADGKVKAEGKAKVKGKADGKVKAEGKAKVKGKVKAKAKVKGKVKAKATVKGKVNAKVKLKVKAEAHPVLEAIRKEVRDRYYTRPSYNRRSKADDVMLPPGCECTPCGIRFKTRADLTSHQRLRHSDTNATRRALCVPGQVYACYRQCDTGGECTRMFKRGDDLVHHIASHHEGVPAGAAARALVHECSECGYQCRRRSKLRQHCDAVHLRIRRHMCHLCGDAFFDKSKLCRHLGAVHHGASDPPAPQYECDTCGRHFNHRGNLAQHLVQHDVAAKAAAQLVCETCGKMYSGRRSLQIHVESQHERQVRFECRPCGYRAYKKSQLLSHQVAKHGHEAKHQCQHCGKYFPLPARLRDHVRRVHRQGVAPATHHSVHRAQDSTPVCNNSTPLIVKSTPVSTVSAGISRTMIVLNTSTACGC